MDKWSLLRLYSIQNTINNNYDALKSDLLKFGYAVKSNLPSSYGDCVIDVDSSFSKTVEPCVTLYFDKTRVDKNINSTECIRFVENLVGEYVVTVYEEDDVFLILDITI